METGTEDSVVEEGEGFWYDDGYAFYAALQRIFGVLKARQSRKTSGKKAAKAMANQTVGITDPPFAKIGRKGGATGGCSKRTGLCRLLAEFRIQIHFCVRQDFYLPFPIGVAR